MSIYKFTHTKNVISSSNVLRVRLSSSDTSLPCLFVFTESFHIYFFRDSHFWSIHFTSPSNRICKCTPPDLWLIFSTIPCPNFGCVTASPSLYWTTSSFFFFIFLLYLSFSLCLHYSTIFKASSIGIFLIFAIIKNDITAYTVMLSINMTGNICGA